MSIATKYVNDIRLTTAIRAVDCANCGLTFGISTEFEDRRRNDHRTFYCPNGHSLSFNGPSHAERERDAARQLAERESRRRKWAEQDAERVRAQRDTANRSAAAYKGWATRIRNRIANGVCPCCNRSFTNVRRHMTTQHPGYKIPEPAE